MIVRDLFAKSCSSSRFPFHSSTWYNCFRYFSITPAVVVAFSLHFSSSSAFLRSLFR